MPTRSLWASHLNIQHPAVGKARFKLCLPRAGKVLGISGSSDWLPMLYSNMKVPFTHQPALLQICFGLPIDGDRQGNHLYCDTTNSRMPWKGSSCPCAAGWQERLLSKTFAAGAVISAFALPLC